MIDWFDLENVQEAKVIVVGAGATGNEVLKTLCLIGIGNIHIIDYDRIEIHNLTRTVLFNENDISKYKAETASKRCQSIDPNINITFSNTDFWNSLTIDMLGQYDALFCCVDNFEARIKLNKLCMIARTDFYNTAIDSRFVSVERYPFGSENDCGCYECGLPITVYEKIRQRYSCGWLKKRAFSEKKVPTTIITSGIAGASACSLFLQKNHQDSIGGSLRFYIDTISLQSNISIIERNDECIGCSSLLVNRQYFKVKNRKLNDFFNNYDIDDDLTLTFSDKIIIDITCKSCNDKVRIADNASKYDDSILFCSKCNQYSYAPEIVDIMTLSQLNNIFGTLPVPIKYLYFYIDDTQYFFELEEGGYE